MRYQCLKYPELTVLEIVFGVNIAKTSFRMQDDVIDSIAGPSFSHTSCLR